EVREPGREAAEEIKEDEAERAERVLDVVAEDPEKPHVSDQVQPSAVQEHRREERRDDAAPPELAGLETVRHLPRHERELREESVQLPTERYLIEKRRRAGDDHRDRDGGKGAGGVLVAQRNHGAPRVAGAER